MQWKRQFPVVLSRRSVSLFLRAPPRRTAAMTFFRRKTDGKFRAPDAPTFNALGAFRSNLRIDDTIQYDTHSPFIAAERTVSRARPIDVPQN